jgi:hypothetical protein
MVISRPGAIDINIAEYFRRLFRIRATQTYINANGK